ncbi:hypothetical protein BDY24DRAFT_400489 [Mrakia frigida]|uniref:uncharacterized protein n=1 Tax=Mrakia frigida TaxID=29902 RepID=UPI003FCC026A
MINSLRGADQLLPSSSSSSTSSPAPPPPSSFRNGSTPSRPPPGLKVLNLDSNRLSNLHGLSGLSSLQRLSLRNNSLSESLELSRLTALPILVDLYVLPNPFSTNPAEEDWRVRLWEGFAREGREETRCPKVDGEGVSWSEKRRMKVLFPTDGGAASRRASRAEMEVPRSPPIVPVGGGTASSQHVRKTSRTTTRERRVGSTMSVEEPAAPADLFSPTKPTQTSSSSSSPPPPFKARKPPLPPSSYHPPSGGSPNQPPSTTTTTPRRKRRHRRIVNLDGGEEDSGTATGTDLSGVSEDESVKPSNGKGSRVQHQHQRGTSERLVSKPAVVEAQDILLACPSSSSSPTKPSSSNDAPTPATPNHSSLRSPPTSTSAAARSSARRARVSASVYEPSPPSPPSGNTSGNGAGSGDEFRKKLEAMRMEVGDSWLRVLSAGERAGAGVAVAGGNKEGEVSGGGTKGKGGEEEVGAEGVESVTVGEGVAVTRVVKKKKKGKSKGKKGGLGG